MIYRFAILILTNATQYNPMQSQAIKQEEQPLSQHDSLQPPLKQQSPFNASAVWNSGHWSQEEQIKSIVFFQFNRDQLHSKLKLKENKFFKQMSRFIQSRNPIQCRSQCHKLLRKHQSFHKAIVHFKEQFGHEQYDQAYQHYSKSGLVRFKGREEQNETEQNVMLVEVATQTDQSYLLNARLKKECEQPKQMREGQDFDIYPFLRPNWWM